MAYNVYFACDICGTEGLNWVNHMVSYSTCVMYARQRGWKVGKRGWICPTCQKRALLEKARKEKRHEQQ